MSKNEDRDDDDYTDDEEDVFSCVVCDKPDPPYRCPNCILQYCSVACYKEHKKLELCQKYVPETKKPVERTSGMKYRKQFYPTRDTIPRKNLKRLCKGENLKTMKTFFENPKIKSYIKILDSCEYPVPEIKAMMQDAEFVEFASFAREVIEAPDDPTKSAYENYRIKARKELMDFFSGKTGKGSRR